MSRTTSRSLTKPVDDEELDDVASGDDAWRPIIGIDGDDVTDAQMLYRFQHDGKR